MPLRTTSPACCAWPSAWNPSQRLIYASSASLYSGNESPDHVITEEVIGFQYQNAYDLSKYAFDKLISTLNIDFIGLRFGTVCGTSPRQRHELLLNSMVRSAVRTGTVQVSNPQARRSVLAMNDLVATIQALIEVPPRRLASTTWPRTAWALANLAKPWPTSWALVWWKCPAPAPTPSRWTPPRSARRSAAR
jgi:nucleoside-diphosphate-sugar epimerase